MNSRITRRHFVALGAAASVLPAGAQTPATPAPATPPPPPPAGPFKLDPLPYAPEALEPHIDALTMKTHHGKHHQAYVNNLNTALAAHADLHKKTLPELLGGITFLPQEIQKAVQNQGGGHWNHTFFWNIMGPGGNGSPSDGQQIKAAIEKEFKTIDAFKAKFTESGMKIFGSGWAWLIARQDGSLAVISTPNQDNPLMQGIVPNPSRGTPLLALDVWEHAYYLKFQSRRAEYIAAWWNTVNWTKVEEHYMAAQPAKGGK